MAEQWQENEKLCGRLSENMLMALAVFPRQVVSMDDFIRSCQMPLSQVQVLVVLSEGSSTVGGLSTRLGIAKPNITPIVNVLCDKELAERTPSEIDRRRVDVSITKKGRRQLKQFQKNLLEQLGTTGRNLSEEEMTKLVDALEIINRFPRHA